MNHEFFHEFFPSFIFRNTIVIIIDIAGERAEQTGLMMNKKHPSDTHMRLISYCIIPLYIFPF